MFPKDQYTFVYEVIENKLIFTFATKIQIVISRYISVNFKNLFNFSITVDV